MGRHSRRGPAPKTGSADITAQPGDKTTQGGRRGARAEGRPDGLSRLPDGAPAHGTRGLPDTAPAHGTQGIPAGTSAPGGPGRPEGTPAHGTPRLPDGTPARGVPGFRAGAPARGGHPEQREAGGGWGEYAGRPAGPGGPGVVLPRQRKAGPDGPGRGPGPRQDYLDAFEGADDDTRNTKGTGVLAAGAGRAPRTDGQPPAAPQTAGAPPADGTRVPAQRGGTKGWAFTGIAAAAVTTVLAVVVAGQVTEDRADGDVQSRSATGRADDTHTSGEPAPSTEPSAVTLTYDQKMGKRYPLSATLAGAGKFDAVPGLDKAPGAGQKYRYRVDVEQGLGLDGALFAEAVQKTLNDKRSWAHGGAFTFERVSSGKPDFVITLASPGTTAKWCAKSGLDTTEDNVSCDSAATERVMINAYRWAQGSKTYGDEIHAYRQMLINHEVGHRLGHGHVTCQKDGALAPVMQQQTKFLDHDGIHCRPNPWPYPTS
ncbi:DUF3152 domain-containing protein [Streptomyces sp. Caat 7-52]|uniref:DUF3152 domain-containing protein n=1 Tax=Streptomyces sp. Caat 7-52 TaxID=2949637 RepID=UPI00203574C7|nr:DUF3152 domain-containing protein [Streptomyces sp. Caat 7-52]